MIDPQGLKAISDMFRFHLKVANSYPDAKQVAFLKGRVYEITDLAIDIADELSKIDPKFDRVNFLLACGLKI